MSNYPVYDLLYADKLLNAYCFVVLKPDCILRGILPSILRYFELNNFKLLYYRCGRLDNRQYTIMYENDFRSDLDSWNLNFKAYEFGPVVGILFLKKPQGDMPSQVKLSRNKGSALPKLLLSNTMRHHFDASSRVFNLFHISDDADKAFIESINWATPEYLSDLFDKYKNKTVKLKSKFCQAISHEISQHGYFNSDLLSGELTIIYLKRRLLHSLETQMVLADSYIKQISQLKTFYEKLCFKMSRQNNRRTRVAIYLRSLPMERGILNSISRKPGHLDKSVIQLIQVMKLISDTKQNRNATFEFFRHLLNKWKVYYTPLEEYLTISCLIYNKT